MKKKVDLIIFDFDGTLVDSQKDIINSVNAMLAKAGLEPKKPSVISNFIGKGVKQLVIDALGDDKPLSIDAAVKIYKDIYREHMFDNTVLYPDTSGILKYFKDKIKVIISNKSAEFIKAALERFAIEEFFIKVSGADNEKYKKPSPRPILKMLTELKIKQAKAVIVGDSPLDIEAGANAGILTCGALYGIGKKEEVIASRPDFLISSISELKDIIE